MPWFLLLLPLLLLVGCSSEEQEAPPKKNISRQQQLAQFSDPVALAVAPGEDGVFVLSADRVSFWKDGETDIWLDASVRSEQIWSMQFSPDWQQDSLFYIFYRNKVGASILSEGARVQLGGELRRKVLELPPSEGGGLSWQENNLLLSDAQRLFRISPFLSRGKAYTIPKDNPRSEEIRAALPEGKWNARSLDDQLVVWGKSNKQTMLWQSDSALLRPQDALWKSKCSLRGGIAWGGGLLFSDGCSGKFLLWKNKEMQSQPGSFPVVVDFLVQDDQLFLLTPEGKLLRQEAPDFINSE